LLFVIPREARNLEEVARCLKDFSSLGKLRTRIVLADGGIYDDMGLESLVDNVDIVLVSNAGAPFEIDDSPLEDELLQLGRVRNILIG
jgi:NTE family protein